MAGLFGLSVSSCLESCHFPNWLYWGTSSVRHLGEDNCGLAVTDGKLLKSESHPGLFSSNFRHRMGDFKGLNGIGYCGLAEEPFWARNSKFGPFALCFSGNITNREKLILEFDDQGRIFERGDDAEVIANLIVQGKEDILEGIKFMDQKVEGAYVLLILTKVGIYAVRSSSGQWPLVLGSHQTSDAICISSDSVGFNNLGFVPDKELEPGEIVFLYNGTEPLAQQDYRLNGKSKIRRCSFWPVYASSPADCPYGRPANLVREELGACLAKKDIASGFIPHIVMPVPDSGISHALGYFQEFCFQMMTGKVGRIPIYKRGLIRYGFYRSFLAPTPEEREQRAHHKIVITSERISDFLDTLQEAGLEVMVREIVDSKTIKIVICDDSIVRGTQIRTSLAPKLRLIFEEDGFRVEIHVRISYPELLSHCPYGKTTKEGEILAVRLPKIEDRVRELGVKSIVYNTLDDLERALEIPRCELCIACALPSS